MDGSGDISYVAPMKSPVHILRRLRHHGAEHLRRRRFARALRHVHGPTALEAPAGAVLAIVLVRDGGYHMDAFLDHYRGLGIEHFAFIDNGSSDDTLARLAAEPGTIVDQCTLPLAGYEDLIRRYPADTYGRDRWCLYVDMDELFDFEGREILGLRGLVDYLEAQGATALMAQMLEMFPATPLAETAGLDYRETIAQFGHYDIGHVRTYPYHSADIPFSDLLRDNSVPTDALRFCFGGVRGKVFGENCCLTKHPLIFNGPGVVPAPHPHLSTGVRCADISAVMRHYKFAGDAALRDAASAGSGDLAHGEDAARAAVFGDRPDISLFSPDARRWEGPGPLVDAGFLVGSDAFADHLRSASGAGARPAP